MKTKTKIIIGVAMLLITYSCSKKEEVGPQQVSPPVPPVSSPVKTTTKMPVPAKNWSGITTAVKFTDVQMSRLTETMKKK